VTRPLDVISDAVANMFSQYSTISFEAAEPSLARCSLGLRTDKRAAALLASAAPSGSPDFACGAEARNVGRASRAEPVRAAAEFRRSGAGPNGTAAARRSAAARGSPVAYGAKACNAGPAFGS
jgi:hypothetical protein